MCRLPFVIYSVFLLLDTLFGLSQKFRIRNSVVPNPWPAAQAATHRDIAETGEGPGNGAEK